MHIFGVFGTIPNALPEVCTNLCNIWECSHPFYCPVFLTQLTIKHHGFFFLSNWNLKYSSISFYVWIKTLLFGFRLYLCLNYSPQGVGIQIFWHVSYTGLSWAGRILLGIFQLEGASTWPGGAAAAPCWLRGAMTSAKATIGSCSLFLTSVPTTTTPHSILIFSSVCRLRGPAYRKRNFYTIVSWVTADAVNT